MSTNISAGDAPENSPAKACQKMLKEDVARQKVHDATEAALKEFRLFTNMRANWVRVSWNLLHVPGEVIFPAGTVCGLKLIPDLNTRNEVEVGVSENILLLEEDEDQILKDEHEKISRDYIRCDLTTLR